ncbi:MAG: CPBP family intramembrane metalloprotease [Burkholderiales bacterium]|nr:CPBP family intramembrane metalloprotease [Burkholderiales bacterium]
MTPSPFDRRPLFWVAYAVLSLACLALAWKLVPHAMPVVTLDIKMTREMAIARAQELGAKFGLAPAGARHAVLFNESKMTQNYVELEGGGKEAFARLVAGDVFAPFWWEVRLFKPGVIDEALVRFKPSGAPNGFTRRVPETYVRDGATKALASGAALALARARAAADWGVDFAPYTLLDQSQQVRPSGRVDHLFVFERGEKLGEARVRLRLAVAGDELIEVAPFVHLPETFLRRFAQMRSANDDIARVATIAAGVLYGLGGCILAVLWLLRRGYLVGRPAFLAGLLVASLLAASALANVPIAWFLVDTAQDETTFWVNQAGAALLVLVGGSLALGEVFMAAESLARRAFPDHPQLWRVWSKEAGATREIAGRTAGGYLWVPVQLGFIAAFYYLTNRYLGWWQPSEQLTDPNILASALPAVVPVAMSLQAGMLEECLFRAIPLALGALIGAHYGYRRLGVAAALLLQALVFGAAHANYPGFPAYSRLVELFLPSLAWAAIFLRYGLLPTILMHALFDLVLMSIPLFLIDAPGAGVQRALVIAAGLVPVAVIAWRRVQATHFGALPEALRNGAWQPPAPAPAVAEKPVAAGVIDYRAAWLQRSLPVLGVLGLAGWIVFTPLHADVPALALDREGAIKAAVAALGERGAHPGPEWTRMAVPRSALDDPNQHEWHAFVWREAGPVAYRALVGNALAPPLWEVRLARFEGDVAARAEEWRVAVNGDARVRQVFHRLPEARPGASLARDDAQALVERTLRRGLGADASALQPRGADEQQRPARRDWVFGYADPRVNVGPGAEARVQVALAGDEVVSWGRSLFIPEAWQRAQVERDGRLQLVRKTATGMLAVCAIVALFYAVVAWNRGRCDRRALWTMAALVFAIVLVGSANNWPVTEFQLRTTEPVVRQLLISALANLAGAVLLALLAGLLAGVGVHYARAQTRVTMSGRIPAWVLGVLAALATAGIAATLTTLVPPSLPVWPDLKAQASASPVLGAAAAGVTLLPAVAVTLFLLSVVDRATAGWTHRVALAALALVIVGTALAAVSGREPGIALVQGAIQGATTFGFAWLVLRYDLRSVPWFVATGLVLDAYATASLRATSSGWTVFAVTATVTVALAWYAQSLLAKAQQAPKAPKARLAAR